MKLSERFRTWNWWAIAILVVSIVISGALLRTADSGPRNAREVPASMGEWLSTGYGYRVRVDNVQVATVVTQDVVTRTTTQVFLVLTISTEVEPGSANPLAFLVESGGSTYNGGSLSVARPGMRTSASLVFEMPPEAIQGATLRITGLEDLVYYQRVLVVDLGLDGAKTADMLARKYQTVSVTTKEELE